jgi:hypothetical protein
MSVNTDMIGERDSKTGRRKYPATTIGGRNYILPVVRIRLDSTHFCVKDALLDDVETQSRVEALRALIQPKSVSKAMKVESNES